MVTVNHPSVLRARIKLNVALPNPTITHVLMVETEMPLTSDQEGFDDKKLGELTEAIVQAMKGTQAERADVIQVARQQEPKA